MAEPEETVPRQGIGGRIGVAALLIVIWVLLWGRVDALTVLGGVLVASALVVVVPQPSAPIGIGWHPQRLVVALGHEVLDIARATVTVAWAAVRTGPRTRAELVTVSLPACSPSVAVLVSSLVSISPGTMVLEIDMEASELLIHVLPVHDLEESRADLQRTVTRLGLALQGGAPR